MSRSKLWTKDFIISSFAYFFLALVFYVGLTTLTVFAVKQFHADQSKAGLAASIFIIGLTFSRLLVGRYMEVIGRKKLLIGGLLFSLMASLLYFKVNDLNMLLAVRFIHGFAFGIPNTVLMAAAMDLIPNERRGEGTSWFSLSSTAAMALGPFIGLLITQHAELDTIFTAFTFCTVCTLIMSLLLKVPEANITQEQLQAMKQGLKLQDFVEKKALPISSIMFLVGIAYAGILSFLNSYAIEIQLEDTAGIFFSVYAAFLFISRPFTGRLLDLKGDNFVIYPSIAVFALSLVFLSQVNNSFVLLLTAVLVALGFGTIMSCAQAIAVKESPKHRVGLAISTFFICIDSGMGIGPFLLGIIVSFAGFRGMYLTLALVVFLSIFLYYFVHGKKAAVKNVMTKGVLLRKNGKL